MSNSLIFGRRGQGKTTLAFYLAQRAKLSIAVFDINGQIASAGSEATFNNLDDLELFLAEGVGALVVYRPESNVEGEFDGFADLLWLRTNYTLLIDEASQIQSAGYAHPKLDRLVRMGPRQAVNLIQTLHRPADVATVCRSLARHFYIFRTRQESDLKMLAERCGPQVAEIVAGLNEHEFVHWDDDRETLETVKDAASWYVDINASPAPGPEVGVQDDDREILLPEVRDAVVAG